MNYLIRTNGNGTLKKMFFFLNGKIKLDKPVACFLHQKKIVFFTCCVGWLFCRFAMCKWIFFGFFQCNCTLAQTNGLILSGLTNLLNFKQNIYFFFFFSTIRLLLWTSNLEQQMAPILYLFIYLDLWPNEQWTGQNSQQQSTRTTFD